jgi:hypothetical protein
MSAMPKDLSYADAVKLLGGADSRAVKALDNLCGGLLLATALGGNAFVLNLFEAKGELARLSGELVKDLRDKVRGLSRFDRSERLSAAHKVIVVTGFFAAMSDVQLPFSRHQLGLTASTQVAIATGEAVPSGRLRLLAEILNDSKVPGAPERLAGAGESTMLTDYYVSLGERLIRYVEGLAVWDSLGDDAKQAVRDTFRKKAPGFALVRYEELLRHLAVDLPEVGFWTSRLERAGLSDQVRELSVGLAGLGAVLDGVAVGRAPDERRRALMNRYRKALQRPIMEAGDTPEGLTIPSLAEAYVSPGFRAAAVSPSATIDRESWWEECPVRDDLQEFLVGYLTSVRAVTSPLIVLGQPGSGKSVLTKILAARLPATDFLAVRVALRDVPADTDVQSQIENAIRAETGESLSWPTLARSTGDALAVVLLDGFDELLQATGIGQTDYLEQVARFQEREADQGRPVAVIVTSRTVVADRARIPAVGGVAIKLEPFDETRVRSWLGIWNASNAGYLRDQGSKQLSAEVVLRNSALSGQPLLLMLLALYDAAENALQQSDQGLDEAGLYERLVVDFVEREVRKSRPELAGDTLRSAVEAELLLLSVTAFSMFNRGRQWVTEGELTSDLAALPDMLDLPRPSTGFREPSTPAQTVVSRFFFIHQAQAIREGRRLTTCEFLHATFGEYLISRLIIRELVDLCAVTAVTTSRSRPPTNDEFLRALLSFAPLTIRTQVIDFLAAQVGRMPPDDAMRIRHLLLAAFQSALEPAMSRSHEDYRPMRLSAPGLHAAYSANLVLLIVLVGGPVTGSELFPGAPFSVRAWRQHALLWRAQFSGEGWRGLADRLYLKRFWAEDDRDIAVSASPWPEPERLEGFWIFNKSQGEHRWLGWRTVRVDALRHESFITCDMAEDVAWHALEPITQDLDARVHEHAPYEVEATTAFSSIDAGGAVSVTHALVRLWLASSDPSGPQALEQAYEDCLNVIERSRPDEDKQSLKAYFARVLRQMAADRDRLSSDFRQRAHARIWVELSHDLYLRDHPEVAEWGAQAFADVASADVARR